MALVDLYDHFLVMMDAGIPKIISSRAGLCLGMTIIMGFIFTLDLRRLLCTSLLERLNMLCLFALFGILTMLIHYY